MPERDGLKRIERKISSSCATVEHTYAIPQIFGFVNKQLKPLASRRHILDVLHHDVLQLVDLSMNSRDRVVFTTLVAGLHLVANHLRELRVHGVRERRGGCESICAQEFLLDLRQVDEGTRSLELVICDAHVDQLVGADVVEQVASVCVGQFVIVQLNFADEILRHLAEVPDAVRIFTEYRVPSRDYCIEQRHSLWLLAFLIT